MRNAVKCPSHRDVSGYDRSSGHPYDTRDSGASDPSPYRRPHDVRADAGTGGGYHGTTNGDCVLPHLHHWPSVRRHVHLANADVQGRPRLRMQRMTMRMRWLKGAGRTKMLTSIRGASNTR